MPIVKNKSKRDKFCIVSVEFLHDKELSLSERGLLATLHSLDEDWFFSYAGTATILPDGKAKIRTAMNGLVSKGYVRLTQERTEDGKFAYNVLEIYDTPLTIKPLSEKRSTVNRSTKKPSAEKSKQYNNKKYNKKQYNNQSINQEQVTDGMIDDIRLYRAEVANNIDLEALLDTASAILKSDNEVAMVREIYELICNMVCYPRGNVCVCGVEYSWETVKSQFLKLRHNHIANILNRVIDKSLDVTNMTAYLTSMLYNEALSGTVKEEADRCDGYLKELRGEPYV